jgi:hypothetical protein
VSTLVDFSVLALLIYKNERILTVLDRVSATLYETKNGETESRLCLQISEYREMLTILTHLIKLYFYEPVTVWEITDLEHGASVSWG